MNNEKEFLKNLLNADIELQKALNILENTYNLSKYIVNKEYNAYAINKVIAIKSLIKDTIDTYYIQQNKRG